MAGNPENLSKSSRRGRRRHKPRSAIADFIIGSKPSPADAALFRRADQLRAMGLPLEQALALAAAPLKRPPPRYAPSQLFGLGHDRKS